MARHAYYNEHEPFAAEWLRRLIEAGLVAPGHVDERDIQDVQVEDLRGFNQHHFFAGIAVWSHALRLAGWPDDRPIWTGSCPCQPFSTAGSGKGTADERHLWPSWFRLIRECKPPVLFGEQVASPAALAWLDAVSADLEGEGYAVGAADLCAAGVGAPHIRQRLYWMANDDRDRLQGRQYTISGQGETCGRRRSADEGSEGMRLADSGLPERTGCEHPEIGGEGQPCDEPASHGGSGRLAHPQYFPEHRNPGTICGQEVSDSECGDDNGLVGGRETLGSLGGFWADAVWIPCSDQRNRPTQSGLFPLAHGTAGRLGRVRAYGNALCAPQAEAFIKAAMQCGMGGRP
jgi:Site-specific DNA methylase